MVMPNSRERFEAEFTRTWPEYVRLTPDVFNRVGDGAYVDVTIHVAFVMWQAGAAAEREKCAKICEDLAAPEGMHGTAVSIWDVATLDCAEAIIRDRSAP